MEKSVKILALILFSVLGFIGILHHEIWLDEAHHFVLARDSNTLSDLYFNNRYEGHPLLWNFLLWCTCKIFPYVFAMQLLHLIIATCSATVVLWYSPFKLYQKVLFCFSYFLFFEYAIISRNYALSLLLIFLCLIQINKSKKNYPFILVLLALIANTHLFSVVICISVFIYLMSSKIIRDEMLNHKKNYPAIILYVFALAFALSFAKVPHDHFLFNYNSDALLSFKRIGKALSICWKSLFHLQPINEFNLWNKNWLIEYNKNIGTIAAALAWFIPFIMFRENKKILILFYAISLCICAFTFISPLIVAVRHSGFIFIAFVCSYWILTASKLGSQKKKSEIIFSLILFQLCISSFIMFKHDFIYPFSGGKKTSAYIELINPGNEKKIICQNTAMPIISSYTGNKVIEINTLTESSFCHWNNNPFQLTTININMLLIKYMEKNSLKTVIYIAHDELNMNKVNDKNRLKYSLLNAFEHSIVKPENYYVYLVEKI